MPSYCLFAAEEKAANGRISCTWLPNAKYILENEPLCALFLCWTHPEGVYFDTWFDIGFCFLFIISINHSHLFRFFGGAGSLCLEELGLDENLKLMSQALEELGLYYDTVHRLSEGLRS